MFTFPLLFAALDEEGDGELAIRLQARDHAALGELYDRYGRLVYSVILRIVRDTGVAEDLTQETFLRAWNRVGQFDAQRGSLAPWVLTVARNRAVDYLRSIDGRSRLSACELNGLETRRSSSTWKQIW